MLQFIFNILVYVQGETFLMINFRIEELSENILEFFIQLNFINFYRKEFKL